ncbi:hypothetical protein VQ643_00980 [Pseudomonas sp. F1_0610]
MQTLIIKKAQHWIDNVTHWLSSHVKTDQQLVIKSWNQQQETSPSKHSCC